jgi:serine/threonine protein phosphatase PrpC
MACSPSAAQEDAHAAVLQLEEGKPGSKSALFAVLDGHGGAEVARFVANHLVRPGRF